MIKQEQIEALKYMLLGSENGSEFSKKICFLLLDKSQCLSKAVCISITQSDKISKELVDDFNHGNHDMRSSNLKTHLGALMRMTGSDFNFTGHCGDYIDGTFKTGVGDDMDRYSGTIWLSAERYDHNAERIPFDLALINSVPLVSALYA